MLTGLNPSPASQGTLGNMHQGIFLVLRTFTAGPPTSMDITGWDFLTLHSPGDAAGKPQLQPQQGQGRSGAVTAGPRTVQWPWSGL